MEDYQLSLEALKNEKPGRKKEVKMSYRIMILYIENLKNSKCPTNSKILESVNNFSKVAGYINQYTVQHWYIVMSMAALLC